MECDYNEILSYEAFHANSITFESDPFFVVKCDLKKKKKNHLEIFK